MSSRGGFSLLEVILALGVVALVMAAIGPALVGVLRAQRQARQVLEPLAIEQAALAQLRDDLIAMPRPNGTLPQPVPFIATAGQVRSWRGDSLQFLTDAPLPIHPAIAQRAPELGQGQITWAVRESEDGRGLTWTRTRQANLLATGTAPVPAEEVMLDHLAQLSVEVLVGSAWVTAYSSDDHSQDLPLAVRIGFAYLAADGSAGPIHTLVIALAQPALDPTQAAGGA